MIRPGDHAITRPFFFAILVAALVALPSLAADWPQYRGPLQEGRSPESGVFPSGAFGLAEVWKRDLGRGYSSILIANGLTVTMYGDEAASWVVALDPETGGERWRYRVGGVLPGAYGIAGRAQRHAGDPQGRALRSRPLRQPVRARPRGRRRALVGRARGHAWQGTALRLDDVARDRRRRGDDPHRRHRRWRHRRVRPSDRQAALVVGRGRGAIPDALGHDACRSRAAGRGERHLGTRARSQIGRRSLAGGARHVHRRGVRPAAGDR